MRQATPGLATPSIAIGAISEIAVSHDAGAAIAGAPWMLLGNSASFKRRRPANLGFAKNLHALLV